MLKEIASDRTSLWLTIILLSVAASSVVLPDWVQNNIMFGLSRALAVLGLLFLWRTGVMSFGHALYFGLGAYAVAILSVETGTTDIFARLFIAVSAAAVVGFLIGFIMRRYRDIFFAMLSLAFSMVLYGILVKTEALGSTDGFSVSQTSIFGWTPESKTPLFIAITLICIIATLFAQMYLRSTMGRLTTAIKDNEIRVEYLGFSVAKAIHIKYVISAALAGGAGGLMAMALGQVDPDSMVYWTVSGELVFVTIMGGAGSVAAPLIASVLFEFLRTYAFELVPHAWQMIVGATLLGIIFFLPGGIWSLLERIPIIRGLRNER